MSRSKHQFPPRRINNPNDMPSDSSSGFTGLAKLARLLARQEMRAGAVRQAPASCGDERSER